MNFYKILLSGHLDVYFLELESSLHAVSKTIEGKWVHLLPVHSKTMAGVWCLVIP